MSVSDRLIDLQDPRIALGLLSRLPFGTDMQASAARGAACAWAFPLVGLVLGGLAAALGALLLGLGLAPALVGVAVVALLATMSGGMHEDGLADMFDGFWGGWEPERRLEIMKDSHIGAYGVIALVLGLGARVLAVASLAGLGVWALVGGVVAAAVLSRTAMVGVMALQAPARTGGLSAGVGQPGLATLALAVVLALVLAIGLAGAPAIVATAGLCVLGFGVMRLAHAKIGGQTGDVLGATQQLGEILVLMVLTAQI